MSSEDMIFVEGAENTTEEVAETNDFAYCLFYLSKMQ